MGFQESPIPEPLIRRVSDLQTSINGDRKFTLSGPGGQPARATIAEPVKRPLLLRIRAFVLLIDLW